MLTPTPIPTSWSSLPLPASPGIGLETTSSTTTHNSQDSTSPTFPGMRRSPYGNLRFSVKPSTHAGLMENVPTMTSEPPLKTAYPSCLTKHWDTSTNSTTRSWPTGSFQTPHFMGTTVSLVRPAMFYQIVSS